MLISYTYDLNKQEEVDKADGTHSMREKATKLMSTCVFVQIGICSQGKKFKCMIYGTLTQKCTFTTRTLFSSEASAFNFF